MIDKIINSLARLNISEYLINDVQTESAELFFVKKKLDVHRTKNVRKYSVTVYRDFKKNDKHFKGDTNVSIYSTMSDADIDKILNDAYEAAVFVCNPFYELPKGQKESAIEMASSLAENSFEDNCRKMTEALFAADNRENVFINSAELFVQKDICRIVNSHGIDVEYSKWNVNGEFVVQCLKPQDVETYQQFSYDDLDTTELKNKVERAIEMTEARARAVTLEEGFKPGLNVIISGAYMKDLFSFYLERASAGNIYQDYSNYSVGCDVKSNISIKCKARTPYSGEGVRMLDRQLVKDGKLELIHGSVQNSYYLGVEPVGGYGSFELDTGDNSIESMKKEPYLHIVNFSDFQMDSMTGEFGGEIRLAFLYDGEKEVPITGGAINASILEHSDYILSSEKLVEDGYAGPFAVCFKNLI